MHYEYEILLFEEGDVSYVIENKRYLLQPYDLLIIPSAKYHFADIHSEKPYKRFVVDFSHDYVNGRLLQEVFSQAQYFHLEKASEIVRLFEQMRSFAQQKEDSYNELACKTLLTEVLLQILRLQRSCHSPEDTVSESVCSAVVEYINQNLTTVSTLDEIANHFFTSKSSLSHQFKQTMGISPMKYIKNKRLLLAQSLLKEGRKPTEIFTLCGYKDYPTFFRAYRSHFKKAPSDK